MNFGLRLDEILERHGMYAVLKDENRFDDAEMEREFPAEVGPDKTKQALTSLIKELVAEAKPYGKRQFRELIEDAWYEAPTAAAGFGRIEAIHNQYEQNLLKALEEV